jgi:cell division protein FtsB
MLQFYQKRSWRALLTSPVALGVLGITILILLSAVYERFSIERAMAAKRQEAIDRLYALEQQKEELEKKVHYLSNERGIEAEMRRNFDVARPGEKVVVIVDPETEAQAILPIHSQSEDTPPWYIFWR